MAIQRPQRNWYRQLAEVALNGEMALVAVLFEWDSRRGFRYPAAWRHTSVRVDGIEIGRGSQTRSQRRGTGFEAVVTRGVRKLAIAPLGSDEPLLTAELSIAEGQRLVAHVLPSQVYGWRGTRVSSARIDVEELPIV